MWAGNEPLDHRESRHAKSGLQWNDPSWIQSSKFKIAHWLKTQFLFITPSFELKIS